MKDISFLKNNGVDIGSAIEILGDIDMYNEILSDFLEISMERITKIEEYKNNNDMKNYAIEVHAMKSDAKYLGFTKLAEMSLEHQLKAEENDFLFVDKHYQELIDEANDKINLAKEYLNN